MWRLDSDSYFYDYIDYDLFAEMAQNDKVCFCFSFFVFKTNFGISKRLSQFFLFSFFNK